MSTGGTAAGDGAGGSSSGAPGVGGTLGSGGAMGSGGALGIGGAIGGDATGLGGAPGIGGSMGIGGAVGLSGGISGLGGSPGSGGAIGGDASGGVGANGGNISGGAESGGTVADGGSPAGGAPDGGSPAGGQDAGGAQSGGALAEGGSQTGGIDNGGASGSGDAGTGGALDACPPAEPLAGGQQYCSNTRGDISGGYSYELWASGSGSGCMTVFSVDANFSATWTDVGDFLARVGLGFDQTRTPDQIGTIYSDFAETKTGDTGLVYIGIYGWTVSPLKEYYIIEDWGSTKPAGVASDGTPRTHAGEITIEGDTYDVWTHQRVDKPAITGDHETFDQYFSVRQTARQCGHIAISDHFSEWAKLGLQLGKLEEAMLLVEAQDSTGTIAFTTATVVVE